MEMYVWVWGASLWAVDAGVRRLMFWKLLSSSFFEFITVSHWKTKQSLSATLYAQQCNKEHTSSSTAMHHGLEDHHMCAVLLSCQNHVPVKSNFSWAQKNSLFSVLWRCILQLIQEAFYSLYSAEEGPEFFFIFTLSQTFSSNTAAHTWFHLDRSWTKAVTKM